MNTVSYANFVVAVERQLISDFRTLSEMGVDAHKFVLEEEVVGDQRPRMN